MSPTVIAFLHFLAWAQHFQWLCFTADSAGNGNHVIYGGNVVDCMQVAQHAAPLHATAGSTLPQCIVASTVPVS